MEKGLGERIGEIEKKARIVLRPRQREIQSVISGRDYFALIWGMQSGKTWASLVAAKLRGGRVLVVCPPRTEISVWKEAMERFEIDGDTVSTGAFAGKGSRSRRVQGLRDAGYRTVILDEIHYYKSWSVRMRAIKAVCSKIPFRLGLTGTPFDSNMLEFFYPMQLLDRGRLWGTRREDFLARHGVALRTGGKRITWEPRDHGELQRMAGPHLDRFNVTTLTGLDRLVAPFALNRFQRRVVAVIRGMRSKEGLRDAVSLFGPECLGWSPPVKNAKIHQAYSGFVLLKERPPLEFDSNKWQAVRCVAAPRAGEGKKILVWVRFVKEYALVERAFRNVCPVLRYSDANLERFKKGGVALVSHPRAAGCGVNISCADTAIFASQTVSGIDNAQAEARLFASTGAKELVFVCADDSTARQFKARMDDKREAIAGYVRGRYGRH